MKLPPLNLIVFMASIFLLAGCADYEFTVNEKRVYSPLPLFTDFQVADAALHDCIQQTIVDQKISNAGQLQVLHCSHAGIVSLQGLEVFTQLLSLYVPHNAISDITPLLHLVELEELDLEANQLITTGGLASLPQLVSLNLKGNPQLQCASTEAAQQKARLELSLPRHCR